MPALEFRSRLALRASFRLSVDLRRARQAERLTGKARFRRRPKGDSSSRSLIAQPCSRARLQKPAGGFLEIEHRSAIRAMFGKLNMQIGAMLIEQNVKNAPQGVHVH